MSILIKGMEKPKDCGICPFELDGFPDEYVEICKLLDRQVGYFGEESEIPSDCPIVDVPTPHGRLIDEDSAIDKAEMLMKEPSRETVDFMAIGYNHGVADCQAILKGLPTIIEAEEGEENEGPY